MIDLQLENVLLTQGGFQLRAHGHFKAKTLGLSGKSGCGKTSFLELVAGLRKPSQGRLKLQGQCLDDADASIHVPARLRRMGLVSQDADLFPHLDVRRNLNFAADRASGAMPDFSSVAAALDLEGLVDRSGKGLSGGERRRVSLGRALLSGPRLLLLDEPFSGLDSAARRKLRASLRTLQGRFGTPWILVSHDPSDLRGLCERIIHIQDGALAA